MAKPRDFSDRRVFVVSTIAFPWVDFPGDYLAMHQACDGPRNVIIGPDVPDERLLRNLPEFSMQYGVTLAQLQAARANGQLANELRTPSSQIRSFDGRDDGKSRGRSGMPHGS